ncbi:alpha-tectorin-like isoform X2 [Mixophyes fleayi]|uniref:alpha-tectorin-like isoform X2 n=1 Tax=Mixophyes fleayi TaxID=3061075 RepID=UPI003F4E1938
MDTVNANPVTEENCPPDMVYGCEPSCFSNCDNLNSTSEICNDLCRQGCHCKSDLVRASENSDFCVRPCACKVTCPKNMHFNPCLTRSEPTSSGDTTKQEFPCKPRCVCNKGYVRNEMPGDVCITQGDCPTPKDDKI